jgi:hypothetical protein
MKPTSAIFGTHSEGTSNTTTLTTINPPSVYKHGQSKRCPGDVNGSDGKTSRAVTRIPTHQ